MSVIEITKSTLDDLLNTVDEIKYETGGILGGDGDLINQFIKDKTYGYDGCICSYSPNTDFLNACIDKWSLKNILFMGIYHTHIDNSPSLSYGDAIYIRDIMNSMPPNISRLYFPVIALPNKEIVCYKAEKDETEIIIVPDELIII